jgi:hypothetical protein
LSIVYPEKKRSEDNNHEVSLLLFSVFSFLHIQAKYQILTCICNHGLQKLAMQAFHYPFSDIFLEISTFTFRLTEQFLQGSSRETSFHRRGKDDNASAIA